MSFSFPDPVAQAMAMLEEHHDDMQTAFSISMLNMKFAPTEHDASFWRAVVDALTITTKQA